MQRRCQKPSFVTEREKDVSSTESRYYVRAELELPDASGSRRLLSFPKDCLFDSVSYLEDTC